MRNNRCGNVPVRKPTGERGDVARYVPRMGEFVSFVVRRWIVASVVVIAIASTTFGYWQNGAELWKLPAWGFQLVGFLLFAGVVTYLLFEWDKKMELWGAKIANVPSLPPPPVGPTPEERAESKREKEREAALIQINSAINDADWEDYTPDRSTITKYMAVLEAAFVTCRKLYGLRTPELPAPSKHALMLGVEYLRAVRPFLAAGHDEEARAAAEKHLG